MDNSGISTVIGLILILGLIVSVAAVVKMTYIPDVKKELEADHMQNVIDDFGQFKVQLDIAQAASTSTGAGYSATAYVEMGGGAIPVVDASASSGTLSLDPAYGLFRIDAYDLHGNAFSIGSATALGRLTYQSNNRYYADQSISYEGGMIVLAQPGGSVMLAPPSFVVAADPRIPGHPLVSVNAFRLNGTPQTFSSAGRGAIQTWLIPGSSALASVNVTNATFTFVSSHAQLWYDYLSRTLAASGLAPVDNYVLRLLPDGRTVTLFINSSTSFPSLYIADSTFGAAMGYSIMAPAPAVTPTPVPTATPTPTPGAITVEFGAAASAVTEGSAVPVTITRTGSAGGAVQVNYAIVGGNATPGTNYTISPPPGIITFADGETVKTIAVYTIDNAVYGGDRTVVLALSNPMNAFLGNNTSTMVTIVDNEPLPSYVQFAAAAYTGEEGGGAVPIVLTRTGNIDRQSRVEFYRSAGNATANSDYTTVPVLGSVTFNAGETTKTITVTIVNDNTVEYDEYVNLSLRNPVNCTVASPATARLTIRDNEFHHFAISASVPWLPPGNDNLTVMAYTRSNQVLTGYRGSVYFTSSYNRDTFDFYNNGHAYTFTAADNGIHVFDGNAQLYYTGGATTHRVTVRTQSGNAVVVDILY